MKKVFKLLLSFLTGASGGFIGVLIFILLRDEMSLAEFADRVSDVEIDKLLLIIAGTSVACVIAIGLQVILHEAGHLIAGLLTGYRFVSFRVGSLTLIKENGSFRIKRFAIAGTGGQCLLLPPNKPSDEIPYTAYNLGGVAMNLLTATLALTLWGTCSDLPVPINAFLLLFGMMGLFLAVMNGIPRAIGGISNDALNLLQLRKSSFARKCFAAQLRTNALLQQGVRLKDMPDELFFEPEVMDYQRMWEVSAKALYASRQIDRKEYQAAYAHFDELVHSGMLPTLFARESTCELLFLELIAANRPETVALLYTPEVQQYVEQFKNASSSKQRLLATLALYRDGNLEQATTIYDTLLQRKAKYLMQGEVASDLEIIKDVIDRYEAK